MLSLWEVAYSSFLHPAPRPPSPAGAEARMHHRAALFNSAHKLRQIVSQTDVVRVLHRHRAHPRLAPCLAVRVMDVPGAARAAAAVVRVCRECVCTTRAYERERRGAAERC
jgi:hypothetical protein